MRHQLVKFIAVFAVLGVMSCGDDDLVEDAGPDGSGATAECGNGDKEGEELCDGRDLGGVTCATVPGEMYTGGTLSCRNNCTFNLSSCRGGDSGADDMDGGGGGAGG